MDLKEKEILGDHAASHWYYVSKGSALLRFIKDLDVAYVLDIGAGSGIFSKLLLCSTSAREAVCCDIGYTREWVERFSGKSLLFKKKVEHSEAGLVLFLDVLEHAADDVMFVKGYVEKLKSGTHVVVTVPAFQFLFSGHDVFLQHYRRYTIASLEKCLSAAGLKVIRSRYYFLFLFPAMVLVRLITKIGLFIFNATALPKTNLRPHGKAVNALLVLINRAELIVFPFNRLAGMTIFSLAVKK